MPVKYCKRDAKNDGMSKCSEYQIFSKKSYLTRNTFGVVICHWKALFNDKESDFDYRKIFVDDEHYAIIERNTEVLTNDEILMIRKNIAEIYGQISTKEEILSIASRLFTEYLGVNVMLDLGIINTDGDLFLFAGQSSVQMELFKKILRMY